MRGAPLQTLSELNRMVTTESQPLTPGTERIGSQHGAGAPDAGWVAGIRARNPDALKHLYHRYRAPVIRFLSLVEPDRAPGEAKRPARNVQGGCHCDSRLALSP